MDIPKWKRDLILRIKNVENHCRGGADVDVSIGLNNCTDVSATSLEVDSVQVSSCLCQQTCDNSNLIKMVQDKSVQDEETFTNGSLKRDSVDSSSSDEDLQYGPGIVNKLKDRYLSLTLREPKIKSRPSILRRATSLENILDEQQQQQQQANKSATTCTRLFLTKNGAPPLKQQPVRLSRYSNRSNRDSIKRARSVETLLRERVEDTVVIVDRDDVQETLPPTPPPPPPPSQKINRPKRIAPLLNEKERPPADVVKSKLRIFESTANRKPRPVVGGGGDVAVKVDKFKTIINNEKKVKKPVLKPKPIFIQRQVSSSLVAVDEPIKCSIETPKPQDELITRPDVSKITELFEKSKPSLLPQDDLTCANQLIETSPKSNGYNEETPRLISRTARENISNAGTSVCYRFDTSPKSKSHLPGGGSSNNLEINGSIKPPPLPKIPPRTVRPTNKSLKIVSNTVCVKKSDELILTNREIENNIKNCVKTLVETTNLVALTTEQSSSPAASSPPPPPSSSPVLLNKVKSVDEIINKSVIESLPPPASRGGQWEQKPWHQQQSNTMVFNFSNRKDVPDYIENDGIIRRPKREKLKPGESGIILLADAPPEDESSTDDFDDFDYSPPGPCDIQFENDNVLINGKSSFFTIAKRKTLKIQFDDNATVTYEYPSETSLMDDSLLSSPTTANNNQSQPQTVAAVSSSSSPPPPSSSSPSPPPLGTLLQNYQPSKIVLNTEHFQLGVTRTTNSNQQHHHQSTSVPTTTTSNNSSLTAANNYDDCDEYLKPANDVDNIPWGSDTVADLLF